MNLKEFFASSKQKFVITIGDEGAVMIHMSGGRLLRRIFFTSPTSEEFLKLVRSAPSAPIYLLVDVIDQAYIQHSLPPVSPLNISKMVKRKLDKDFDENDIRTAIPLGREKTGRRDWNYLFVAVRNIPPFSDWVDTIAELPNRLAGIYLLPIESEFYLKDIRKIVFLERSQKEAKWQAIVSHNRVGGLRQIVFKNNKIIFTRVAQPIGGMAPYVIAGNIEQETLNTLEYIRRLGFQDEDGIDIFAIASEEVQTALETHSIPANSFSVVTPYAIATQLGLNGAAEPTDRFGDVVFAAHFGTGKKHGLRLNTKYTARIDKTIKLRVGARLATAVSVIGMLVTSALSFYNASELEQKVGAIEKENTMISTQLASLTKAQGSLGNEAQRTQDIAKFHSIAAKNDYFALDFFTNYAAIRGFNVTIQGVGLKSNVEPEVLLSGNPQIAVEMQAVFFNPDNSSLDRIIEDVNLYTEDVRRKFRDYKVTFSDLPSEKEMKLDLEGSGKGELINISINIDGPINKAAEAIAKSKKPITKDARKSNL